MQSKRRDYFIKLLSPQPSVPGIGYCCSSKSEARARLLTLFKHLDPDHYIEVSCIPHSPFSLDPPVKTG